jgi:thiol:disulfide interchange protein
MRNHASSQGNIPNNQRQMPGSVNDSSASNNNLSSAENRNNEQRLQHTKSTRLKDHREAKQKRNEWRITKMVLAIFLSFLACYLPITIIKVADKVSF